MICNHQAVPEPFPSRSRGNVREQLGGKSQRGHEFKPFPSRSLSSRSPKPFPAPP
jgi:hypothetical protein